MKTNEVIVQRQPRHILMSVVVVGVGEIFPLTSEQQGVIDNLGEVSDVFFVFNAPSKNSGKRVDPGKFCSLHSGMAYLECENLGSLNSGILKALQYSVEIFGKHLGYVITRVLDLGKFKDTTISNLVTLNNSTITRPVLSIKRLGSEILAKYYITETQECEQDIWHKVFSKCQCFSGPKIPILDNKLRGMNCRYTSLSEAAYLRTATVRLILSRLGTLEFSEFLESFEGLEPESFDYRYFLGSLLKDMGIDNIDSDPGELEIGKL